MNNCLVSILCISYNHEKYIGKTIDSFLMQKVDFDYEIIIGEDCSTDRTKAIIENYVKAYPNKITLITSDYNVGCLENMNRIERISEGKYIAVCEGDDYWTDPKKLQIQIDYMEANPNCSLTFHGSKYINEDGKFIGQFQRSYEESKVCPINDVIMLGGSFIPTASMVYRHELFKKLPDSMKDAIVGDYPKQMLLASRGTVYYFDRTMCAYRYMHAGSWTLEQVELEKGVSNINGIIQILGNFDQETNGKYTQFVEEAKKEHRFEIAYMANNLKLMRGKGYINIWRKKKLIYKIKTIFKCKLPNIYNRLQRIKNKNFD